MSTPSIQTAAIISGGFLSGAIMSVSLVAIPTILNTATQPAHLQSQWARVYQYGHYIMPAIAVGTGLVHGYICLNNARAGMPWRIFALAGITTMGIAPFTWMFMLSTNNELFRVGLKPQGVELPRVKELVAKWMWLNYVRSLFPMIGAIIATNGRS